ncbi:(Fe-S)-binding protein [Holophaga foetida]|uniref:(Fe-S)-binding protein n=1 Tax=Holophaga foetida TaxID=35839 RepID=UPI0002474CF8|nr:(Fe-S)-binding protein [Holophaga foetida]
MEWRDLEAEVVRCSRCGACQQVCPIFRELGTEASATRGKIGLIRSAIHGWVSETEGLSERMSLCLACKACTANCPSGVQGDQLVLAARQRLVERRGLPLIKRLALRFFLKHKGIFRVGMKLGPLGQRLVLRRTPKGCLPRLPMGLDKRRLVPELASRSLRERYPEVLEAPMARGRVALFTGCMVNHVYPEIGVAAIEVLLKQGISVVIPPDQHCCGLPAFANGDTDTALELGRATLGVFQKYPVDAVLTLCGSCGGTLKQEYRHWFAPDPELAGRAKALSEKVQDFAQYLDGQGLLGSLGPLKGKVTYHDSCHLARGMGVTKEPRNLIRAIPGLVFQEMEAPARCCGAAGSFSLTHYDLTLKINGRKTEDILNSGADTVVTGCPGCIMQLKDGLHKYESKINVIHFAQLLRQAIMGNPIPPPMP